MIKKWVDLNCDMGESFGRYTLGLDNEILKYVSSANIACGFHAGDYMVMAKTVEGALKNQVAIGAHPGYPDLQGFGRRSMDMTLAELKNMILYQIGALDAITRSQGGKMNHVKLHGALNNDCNEQTQKGNHAITEAVGQAILEYNPELTFVCYTKTPMVEKLREMGLHVVEEVFADRAYNADCTLVSRRLPGSVITSPEEVIERILRMVKDRTIITIDGQKIEGINPDTICFHGDTPAAVELTRQAREAFAREGVEVRSFM